MQLNKQNRKAARSEPRHRFVKIESFNPVVKPGTEIASVSTIHNFGQVTHCLVVTQPKAAA